MNECGNLRALPQPIYTFVSGDSLLGLLLPKWCPPAPFPHMHSWPFLGTPCPHNGGRFPFPVPTCTHRCSRSVASKGTRAAGAMRALLGITAWCIHVQNKRFGIDTGWCARLLRPYLVCCHVVENFFLSHELVEKLTSHFIFLRSTTRPPQIGYLADQSKNNETARACECPSFETTLYLTSHWPCEGSCRKNREIDNNAPAPKFMHSVFVAKPWSRQLHSARPHLQEPSGGDERVRDQDYLVSPFRPTLGCIGHIQAYVVHSTWKTKLTSTLSPVFRLYSA